MFLSLARILKFSFQDMTRNIWLTIVTITVLILSLILINTLLVVKVISNSTVKAIKEKVDITLYIKASTHEDQILALKAELSSMEGVRDVVYNSKEEALEFFRTKNQSNPEVLQALRELGRNPLSPSLIVYPTDVNKSADLINKLQQIDSEIIESRDFSDNSLMLEKIDNITKKVSQVGLLIVSIFVLISLSVVYNSIRVAIYTHRREIAIMRLVGASNIFIYLPFLFSAIFYTLVGILFVIALFYPFLSLLQPYLEVFFTGYSVNIVQYFSSNFWNVFGLQFLVITVINILASLVAVRKYAKV